MTYTKTINDICTLETNKYRKTINNLSYEKLSLVNRIENARLKYVDEQIKLINDDGIFSYLLDGDLDKYLPKKAMEIVNINLKYNDYNAINRILKNYTEKCLLEYIIDLYFKEITYNFISNLKNIIRYINEIKDNIISKDNLLLYKKILNFHNLSLKEQKDLFYNYDSNINYKENYYDDFSMCKKHSYLKINDSIIKKEQLNKLKNKELSSKYNVNIYELNGENFYLYVHASKVKNNDFPFKKGSNDVISLSLIGHENIGTYKTIFENILLGFENLNENNIIHLFNSDSYTSNKGSKKIQGIYTPEKLLSSTYGYNEILYSEKNIANFYPSYIVCFDNIRDIDLYFAQKENLPIIKINSIVYRKCNLIEDRLENTYMDADEASEISSYRCI